MGTEPVSTPKDDDVDVAIALAEAQLLLMGLEEGQSDGGDTVPLPPPDSGSSMTLPERAEEVVGLDPDVERLTLLPYPKGALKKDADVDWLDWVAPQIVADMTKSAILPGHVLQGGDFNIEDVVKFALDYAVPAAQTRMKTKKASDKEVVNTAPATEALREQGGRLLEQARRSGARLEEDDVMRLLSILEKKANLEGLDKQLHPATRAALNYANDRLIESGGDMRSLMLARRNLGTAATPAKDIKADDLRIAQQLMNIFDGFVEARLSDPKISGMKRAELIENIITKAELSASGIEKGLQSGFRSLLNNKTKLRGFNDEDKALMKRIVQGGPVKKLVGFIGKFSFAGSRLGGALATGVGAFAAGPVGAVAAPIVAQGARSAAGAATSAQAELARALAAGGVRGAQVVRRPLLAPPVAGALPPAPQQPLETQNMYPAGSQAGPRSSYLESDLGGIQGLSDILRGHGDFRDPGREIDRVRRPRFPVTARLRPGGA